MSIEAAGQPPPGVVSNFAHPQSIAWQIYLTDCICLSVSVTAVGLRLYTRFRIIKHPAYDDLFVCIALVFALAHGILTSIDAWKFGLGIHMWDMPLSAGYLHVDIAASIIYIPAICFTKLAIITLLLHLFGHRRNFAIWMYALGAFIAAYSLAGILALSFMCSPIPAAWDISIQGKCINRDALYYAQAALNIVTDIVVFVSPLPLLQKLQLPLRQRLVIISILLAGAFACITSIIRIFWIKKLFANDLSWDEVKFVIMCIIEINLGIICASISTLRPLVSLVFPAFVPSSSRSRRKTTAHTLSHKRNTFAPLVPNPRASGGHIKLSSFHRLEASLDENTSRKQWDVETQVKSSGEQSSPEYEGEQRIRIQS